MLRVWHIKNLPNFPYRYPVCDPDHGVRLISALIESDLLDDSIESNAFGMESDESGMWEEWYSPAGVDIMTLVDDKEKHGG